MSTDEVTQTPAAPPAAPEAENLVTEQNPAEATGPTSPDRRRPGRPAHVAPSLLGLLRSPSNNDAPQHEGLPLQFPRAAAQGILFAVAIGIVVWTGLFLVVRSLLN